MVAVGTMCNPMSQPAGMRRSSGIWWKMQVSTDTDGLDGEFCGRRREVTPKQLLHTSFANTHTHRHIHAQCYYYFLLFVAQIIMS